MILNLTGTSIKIYNRHQFVDLVERKPGEPRYRAAKEVTGKPEFYIPCEGYYRILAAPMKGTDIEGYPILTNKIKIETDVPSLIEAMENLINMPSYSDWIIVSQETRRRALEAAMPLAKRMLIPCYVEARDHDVNSKILGCLGFHR